MAFIATAVGGAVGILLLSFIIERLAYKDKEPTKRAELTVGTALIVAAVLAGFGMADGGGFVWTAGAYYLPGAIAVFLWFRKRYADKWVEDELESAPE